MDYVFDVETYPNVFTMAVYCPQDGYQQQFEISPWRNDDFTLRLFLIFLRGNGHRMVGYNNIGFDYPLIHLLINTQHIDSKKLYDKAMAIIDGAPFEHRIWPSDWFVPQIDLYRIHHFDNRSRSTSLKVLEFNMRCKNIEDLPFVPGTILNPDQIKTLHKYNLHDVLMTARFYEITKPMIEFREQLSKYYGENYINHNDAKIGSDFFIKRLKSIGIKPKRPISVSQNQKISLKNCIFPYISFQQSEFNNIKNWLMGQTITETKGVFKNLKCTVNDFTFVFGLGGIHGSVKFREFYADQDFEIIDLDVVSYYARLAIVNRVYPQHLSEAFCDIYQEIFNERKKYEKGSLENALYKLALNGVYGNSNNIYSAFYDPRYTMTITLNGQLLLCMLAEWLLNIESVELIQINTDGLTIRSAKNKRGFVDQICTLWAAFTQLELKKVHYQKIFIKDCNNYIAQYPNGDVKRIGAYEYEREWHQNHSALVIPKAVEAHLIHGESVRRFITQHRDYHDFMLRVKLPRTMRLQWHYQNQIHILPNTTRYYVSLKGGSLKKIMPSIKKGDDERIRDIESGWLTTPCNDISRANAPINYDYYVTMAERLILELH